MATDEQPLWSRRDFLGVGVGGAACFALGGVPAPMPWVSGRPFDDLAGKVQNLVLRYRTDPERIARILPPGLEPDEDADVMLDWWVRHPVPGEENIFFPGVYGECGIHVTARYQGRRGMLQVGMPLDQDWGRSRGREDTGLVKKDGVVGIERRGDVVTADLRRRGKLLYRIRTRILLNEPAHPLFWHRETGFGQFLYRYRLAPDWREGPLDPDHPVELWSRVLAGRRGWYPEEMLVGGPRRCDPGATEFEFVDPAPLDPFGEFPMRGIVGMGYDETDLAPEDARAYREHAPGTQSRIERLQLIDPERFEPWALYNYDRPITDGRAWVPSGWPETVTALKLTERELERYRARDALVFDPLEAVEVTLRIDPSRHARTLPPGLDPGPEPWLRILALRVERSDLSTEPFEELWLLARCLEDDTPAWYALSHIVGPGGDVVFGRETFGYPSKTGTVSWQNGPRGFEIVGRRLGRDFVRLGGEPAAAEGSDEEELHVVGLRRHPPYRRMTLHGFTERGPELELVAQPWSVELEIERPIDPGRLRLQFPEAPGPGVIGRPDPWYEFGTATTLDARVGRGAVRRGPGVARGISGDLEPYYRERFDGARTTGEATSGRAEHTFLIGP